MRSLKRRERISAGKDRAGVGSLLPFVHSARRREDRFGNHWSGLRHGRRRWKVHGHASSSATASPLIQRDHTTLRFLLRNPHTEAGGEAHHILNAEEQCGNSDASLAAAHPDKFFFGLRQEDQQLVVGCRVLYGLLIR